MSTLGRLVRSNGGGGLVTRTLSNLVAQGAALASVSLASLVVARAGGPAVVGEYALLRLLPWLFAVLCSCGLPTACAFFLAGPRSVDRRLRPTIAALAGGGAAVGVLTWLLCAVPVHHVLFAALPLSWVLISAALVVTQLVTVTAKACCQGTGDIGGANLVIVVEELYFVGVYPVVLVMTHDKSAGAVLVALILSGALAAATGLARLRRNGFFAGWGRPSRSLAGEVAWFGARGQLGNMLWLMNLRFDFLLLGALAGPAVLGIYAVASKFAELMRLAPTAMNYVLYPRFASMPRPRAVHDARRLLPRATLLTLAATPAVLVLTVAVLPLLYGEQFRGAVRPAEVIIIGLSVEGAAAVASAFLLGVGRPGLNSLGMGVGTAVTVAMDIALIPRFGAMGGAVTSAVAYLTSTVTLTLLAHRTAARIDPHAGGLIGRSRSTVPSGGVGVDVRPDTALRRGTDLVVSAMLLVLLAPVLLACAVAVRLTSPGPAFYRQVRAGRSGCPFVLFKLRSMVDGADRVGPLITDAGDPRVTWVGRVLRATKLDELPQLVNVLRGDMTLVGPRPEVERYLPSYRPDELQLLGVRPGLTGPGQIFYTREQASTPVDGDAETFYRQVQLHEKLALDLEYLRSRGLRADLRALAATAALLAHVGRSHRTATSALARRPA
jgi:lipopolysaccharide/colanic/teichoic acid biosynthesis glycosyltransferase/O-antigen/teichoic acid export membrane protein